ncbi:MAG TPA: cytochrome c oxidase subunit II [Alphaproteobacteria bacterium]|nr:cytochrome c oxidase subunit II [Alphaproteobacteria bacterium]
MIKGFVVALIFFLVAAGTVAFHIWSPWWFTPIASNWEYIDHTIVLTFWITGFVFVAVIVFMAYCLLKYRHRGEARSEYNPENKKLEWWLTGLTAVGVVAMLTPGLFVWNQYVTVPEDAQVFEVMGRQWDWSFRLPGKDGALGKTSPKFVDFNNPFGIDPKDPNGQDDLLVGAGYELHVAKDQPIKVLLRSLDVLHDFYVPEFRAKMDMVPGMVTYFWVEPTRTGTFDIMCFELCGVGHYAMRAKIIVDEPAAYQEWVGQQKTFAQSLREAGIKPLADMNVASSEKVDGMAQDASAAAAGPIDR